MDTITMNGHIFYKKKEGMYETKDIFEFTENHGTWMTDSTNANRILICKKIRDKLLPWIITTDEDHDNYYNFMKEYKGDDVFALIADPPKDGFNLGGVFI